MDKGDTVCIKETGKITIVINKKGIWCILKIDKYRLYGSHELIKIENNE